MSNYVLDVKYGECIRWIRNKRDRDISWEELAFACKGSEEGLRSFLAGKKEDDDWPQDLSCTLWQDILVSMQKVEKAKQEIRRVDRVAEIHDPSCENLEVFIPPDVASSWQLYKKHLSIDKHFSDDAVGSIEDASIQILKRLSRNTLKSGPVKGLVIGNVQSGKTANMAGLMAMAADWGWNLFIVLSGTIENLRVQTQNRMIDDLNVAGNLAWIPIEHPSKKKSVAGQRMCDLNLGKDSNTRYLTVCLKAKSRLEDLIEWIEADKEQLKKLRVLVIDDEADQAGVSTGDVSSDLNRTTINRLILNLINCRNKEAHSDDDNTFSGEYQAMNYVSYTATPYANCLNEAGPNTLYPEHFIRTLDVSRSYFGPDKIFGRPDVEASNSMDIVRDVKKDELQQIKDIQMGIADTIPKSLKNSLLWFFCAVGVARYRGYKKPVSMLIHTSQKQEDHRALGDFIKSWIINNRQTIIPECKEVYKQETNRFTKTMLREVYPDYEQTDEFIWDYPSFKEIETHISDLVSSVSAILLDEEGALKYGRGIHLCIDNCASKNPEDYGYHVRLAYPDEKTSPSIDFATAFIVVGGNTLSRGLTLEGLVSTFFLRTVRQADTLMQMGRWFGYRPHYELLPRIWMTEDTQDKFRFLDEIDIDLREQIYRMQLAGKAPLDFNLALKTSPRFSWLRLTSKNKMQMADSAEVDFTGSDTQLTVYSRSADDIKNNLAVAENFIVNLGNEFRQSETSAFAYIWENVSFTFIMENFFKKGFRIPDSSRAFQEMNLIAEWVASETNNGHMTKWNVLLCGNKPSEVSEEKIWHVSEKINIGKITRSCKTDSGDRVNIGVLSGKKDYVADIRSSDLSEELWEKMKSDKSLSTTYRDYREAAGVQDIPLLLIYKIDKDSRPQKTNENSAHPRTPLNVVDDLVGITMVVPGIRGEVGVTRVKLKYRNETDMTLEGNTEDEN